MTTVEEARAAVQRVKQQGADFVKVYNAVANIPRDAYLAVLAESRRQGLRVTGHLIQDVPYSEAAEAGQQFEHAVKQ